MLVYLSTGAFGVVINAIAEYFGFMVFCSFAAVPCIYYAAAAISDALFPKQPAPKKHVPTEDELFDQVQKLIEQNEKYLKDWSLDNSNKK